MERREIIRDQTSAELACGKNKARDRPPAYYLMTTNGLLVETDVVKVTVH